MAIPPRYQRHQYLRSEGLGYTDADIINFKERLGRIYGMLRDIVYSLAELRGGYLRFKACWIFPWNRPVSILGITDSDLRLCHLLIACIIAGGVRHLRGICGCLLQVDAWGDYIWMSVWLLVFTEHLAVTEERL
ncbi:hypothetical protein Tco_0085521 [Tanacetum coccineum]